MRIISKNVLSVTEIITVIRHVIMVEYFKKTGYDAIGNLKIN